MCSKRRTVIKKQGWAKFENGGIWQRFWHAIGPEKCMKMEVGGRGGAAKKNSGKDLARSLRLAVGKPGAADLNAPSGASTAAPSLDNRRFGSVDCVLQRAACGLIFVCGVCVLHLSSACF
jgi:hypothetical protein